MYLPAPNDAVAEQTEDGLGIKVVHRVAPRAGGGGCDFPNDLPLRPVMLPDDVLDFKPAELPAWWPLSSYGEWLTTKQSQIPGDWFTNRFLKTATQEIRDHVAIEAATGAAKDGHIFSTTGLNVGHLRRFGAAAESSFHERFAAVALSIRVSIPPAEKRLQLGAGFRTWHPLGGERRLVHWQVDDRRELWTCPGDVRKALAETAIVRMVLTTPAIFTGGWKPGWLNDQLEGEPPGTNVKLTLIGVTCGRWKAVSGWSLAALPDQPRGAKPIRRTVPAGAVYFFTTAPGDAAALADHWLQPVSDEERERRDGFGLAVWGAW